MRFNLTLGMKGGNPLPLIVIDSRFQITGKQGFATDEAA
jgi:hypothetical protein